MEAVSETLLRVNPLYFLIAGTYALTVIHALALRFLRSAPPSSSLQVVGDLLVITGLVYVTGGRARAGFMLLYPISVLSGSVLLYRRAAWSWRGLATLCYAAILWAVRVGAVPPQGLADVPYLPVQRARATPIFVTGGGLHAPWPSSAPTCGEPEERGGAAGGGGGAGGGPARS